MSALFFFTISLNGKKTNKICILDLTKQITVQKKKNTIAA